MIMMMITCNPEGRKEASRTFADILVWTIQRQSDNNNDDINDCNDDDNDSDDINNSVDDEDYDNDDT